jgi:hypothetical protein
VYAIVLILCVSCRCADAVCVPYISIATLAVVDYYIDDERAVEREDIVRLVQNGETESSARSDGKLEEYVRDAFRMLSLFSLSCSLLYLSAII